VAGAESLREGPEIDQTRPLGAQDSSLARRNGPSGPSFGDLGREVAGRGRLRAQVGAADLRITRWTGDRVAAR